ncbi:MAG TPA: DUF3857 domain-containing protein [Acidobacteriaceae bacterium]|nr:DUF3857 domain-containing protein [Acidobacteriaceae bacterium]
MTSDPAAPDTEAVYLFREETVDDKLHFHRLYVRIKILTEKGKEDYSNIEIPYEAGVANIRDVEGRTIHADGTIIPFNGQLYDKELVRAGDTKINQKSFSMPDVQVGSIVEYRWELAYDDAWCMPPRWTIQQPIYVHKAHYHFVPVDLSLVPITVTDALGKTRNANQLLYYPALPPGVRVREGADGFDLTVENIASLPDEEYSPPLDSYAYRLLFYYSAQATGDEFWKQESKTWSKDVDRFANPSGKIKEAVAQLVAPGDTDDQKLQKIYAAVMKVENTRFTRERSTAENKAEGLRVKNAGDIWDQKRGSDDEITRLFLAMARAAGMKAYAMIVTERDRALLNTGYLNWGQLEDEIAIVTVNGKEEYFDPGQRYCDYGKLHWMHTQVAGIRQTDHDPTLALTPAANLGDNITTRIADLQLDADGKVTGTVRITMTGEEALRWRQTALRGDEQETKKQFEAELQRVVPDGVQVKMNHFLGLNDNSTALMGILDVSGTLGTSTGKRVFLPASLFEANAKPRFAAEKRESMVDLRYPYAAQDKVTLTLPPGLSVQSVPNNAEIPLARFADYQAQYQASGDTYQQSRVLRMGNAVYKTTEYMDLRDFFQKTAAQDQQQLVLVRAATTASASGGAGKSE